MEFTEMRDKLREHFNEMVNDVDHLFEVTVDKRVEDKNDEGKIG